MLPAKVRHQRIRRSALVTAQALQDESAKLMAMIGVTQAVLDNEGEPPEKQRQSCNCTAKKADLHSQCLQASLATAKPPSAALPRPAGQPLPGPPAKAAGALPEGVWNVCRDLPDSLPSRYEELGKRLGPGQSKGKHASRASAASAAEPKRYRTKKQ